MKNLLRWVGAIALALLPSLALAQAPVGRQIYAPAGYLPAEAIYCDDGTGHAALCSFGTGGSGGGSSAPSVFSRVSYVATGSGTGYAVGDQIVHMVTTNATTGALQKAYWVDVTQETVLSTAPSLSNLSQVPTAITNTAFGANCLVVSGNQAYTVGAQQQCNMTATGRIKVGISSAGNIDPAAQLSTTLDADIIACKYRVSPITWSDLWTGAIRCNSTGAVVVDNVVQSTPTDRGQLIGTTAVTVAPANPGRRGWSIQVQGSSGSCYLNTITTATADYHSLQIGAGGYIQSPESNVSPAPLSVICTAASTPVFFREW